MLLSHCRAGIFFCNLLFYRNFSVFGFYRNALLVVIADAVLVANKLDFRPACGIILDFKIEVNHNTVFCDIVILNADKL